MKQLHLRRITTLALAGFAGTAAAHTGHGTESLFAGLAHPFGLDHLLAMLAVGMWSVFALPAGRTWAGPLTFLLALAAGALAGAGTAAGPMLEVALAASVVVLGAMMVTARRLPAGPGLVLVALAAALHGLAHGAEAPAASGLAGYAAGFLITTAGLHFGGVSAGLWLRRVFALRATQVVGGLGVAMGGVGVYLLSHF